jgi:hypothetical protein
MFFLHLSLSRIEAVLRSKTAWASANALYHALAPSGPSIPLEAASPASAAFTVLPGVCIYKYIYIDKKYEKANVCTNV